MTEKTHQRVNLKTKRLLLRPFKPEDIHDIDGMGGFPTWDLSQPNPFTRQHAEEYLARLILRSWDKEPVFAIVLNSKVVGIIGFDGEPEDLVAEFGYSLDKTYWGKGIMLEAAHKFLSWVFTEYDLVKISASVDIANKRSVKVLKSLGMTKEAVFRKEREIRGVRTDMIWYGLLAEEWMEYKSTLFK